jgi:uncharacterized protein YndB with AHSA1/START domain
VFSSALNLKLLQGDFHRQFLEAAQRKALAPVERVRRHGQMQAWKAAKQRGQGDLALQSGQRCTETEVRSHSKRDVPVGLAGNVECFGIGELRFIVVCRSQTHADKFTARNRDRRDRRASWNPLRPLIRGLKPLRSRAVAGGLFVSSAAGLELRDGTAVRTPSNPPANVPRYSVAMCKTIKQRVKFKTDPATVYDLLADSRKHTVVTGRKATISTKIGGTFSLGESDVTGINVDLVPGRRIVQAWRHRRFPEGIFSMAAVTLTPTPDGGTDLVLVHRGVPKDLIPETEQAWRDQYWSRIKAYLDHQAG